jgi:hypothetical protein
MGNVHMTPSPPAGAVVAVIEAGGCCDACQSRRWDPPRPSFVPAADWQTFTSRMGQLVQTYKAEGKALYCFIILGLDVVLFHPSLGVIARSVGLGVSTSLAIFMGTVFLTIVGMYALICGFRSGNMQVDQQITDLCRRASNATPGVHFQFATAFTEVCKPKGARTYRAVYISPRGAHGGVAQVQAAMPMQSLQPAVPSVTVACPPNAKEGDQLQVTSPTGQPLLVSVPAGVIPGMTFVVQTPPQVVVQGVPMAIMA